MPSVKETIQAAKDAAKAKVNQLMQSNAEKIDELIKQAETIKTQIASRIETKVDMVDALNKGEVPEEMTKIARRNIQNARIGIEEKVQEANDVIKKIEKLGGKDQAKALKDSVNNMINEGSAVRRQDVRPKVSM